MRAAEEWVGLREILQDVRTRGEVLCPIEPATCLCNVIREERIASFEHCLPAVLQLQL